MNNSDIYHIARALGGRVIGRNRVAAPGPGHGRNDRSLVLKLDSRAPDGFIVHSHANDDWKTCRDYVRERLGLPAWHPGDDQDRRIGRARLGHWDTSSDDTGETPDPLSKDEIDRINAARRIWADSQDPRGTIADRYLQQHRKLKLPDHLAGDVLRFHGACPWHDENSGKTIRVPALIAPFRALADNSITGIQRIRLNSDGSKHSRRMMGVITRAAIKLDPAGTDELCIGEGVETCLAGRQLGFTPVWSLGSVGAISFFPVIDGVKRLTIFGETGEASASAIKICSERWQRQQRHVRLCLPDEGYDDLNDELMATTK
jgi:hypothetical protein